MIGSKIRDMHEASDSAERFFEETVEQSIDISRLLVFFLSTKMYNSFFFLDTSSGKFEFLPRDNLTQYDVLKSSIRYRY